MTETTITMTRWLNCQSLPKTFPPSIESLGRATAFHPPPLHRAQVELEGLFVSLVINLQQEVRLVKVDSHIPAISNNLPEPWVAHLEAQEPQVRLIAAVDETKAFCKSRTALRLLVKPPRHAHGYFHSQMRLQRPQCSDQVL